MYQQFYSHSTLLYLPLFALLLFVLSFAFAVWHTLRRTDTDDLSQLPLQGDDVSDDALCSPDGGRHV